MSGAFGPVVPTLASHRWRDTSRLGSYCAGTRLGPQEQHRGGSLVKTAVLK